jgi:DNA/RNA endonuclease G (NUC1)
VLLKMGGRRGHRTPRAFFDDGARAPEDGDEIAEADVHSFRLTNACAQIDNFNGQNGEWFQLERTVVAASDVEGLRLTEFVGPIFRADDHELTHCAHRTTRRNAGR